MPDLNPTSVHPSAARIAAIACDASFDIVDDDEADKQDEPNTTFEDSGPDLRAARAKSPGLLLQVLGAGGRKRG